MGFTVPNADVCISVYNNIFYNKMVQKDNRQEQGGINMTKIKKYKRHGDVILHPIDKIKGTPVQHNGKFTLALGEVTGHSHQLLARPEQMTVVKNKGRTLLSVENAELVHQQHKKLNLIGKYAQVQERELDHFSKTVRTVVD